MVGSGIRNECNIASPFLFNSLSCTKKRRSETDQTLNNCCVAVKMVRSGFHPPPSAHHG